MSLSWCCGIHLCVYVLRGEKKRKERKKRRERNEKGVLISGEWKKRKVGKEKDCLTYFHVNYLE
jgi:hypothetical protein